MKVYFFSLEQCRDPKETRHYYDLRYEWGGGQLETFYRDLREFVPMIHFRKPNETIQKIELLDVDTPCNSIGQCRVDKFGCYFINRMHNELRDVWNVVLSYIDLSFFFAMYVKNCDDLRLYYYLIGEKVEEFKNCHH